MTALQDTAAYWATQYGVPVELFLAQIGQESSWNASAVSGNNHGIAQLSYAQSKLYGNGDPYDATDALKVAAIIDSKLYAKTGSWQSVLRQYGTTAVSSNYGADAKAAISKLDQYAASFDKEGGNMSWSDYLPSLPSLPSLSGIGSSISSGVSGAVDSVGSAISKFLKESGLIALAIVLVLGGLYMLASKGGK